MSTSATPRAGLRRRLGRDERARSLLDAAEHVFAEQGIRSASMEDIAARAGVTKPIIYDHFRSKDDLLAAVVVRAGDDLYDDVVRAVGRAPTPEAALASGLRAYFGFIERHGPAWSALLAEGAAATGGAAEVVERIRDRLAALIAGLIVSEVPRCDRLRADIYAQSVVGACERLAQVHHDEPPAKLASTVMEMIWIGFRDVIAGERYPSRTQQRRS